MVSSFFISDQFLLFDLLRLTDFSSPINTCKKCKRKMCDLYTICLIARVKEAHPMLLQITVLQWLTMGGRKGWIMEKPAIVERICYIWRKPHFSIAIFGVSPVKPSWCCTCVLTWKVTKIVVNQNYHLAVVCLRVPVKLQFMSMSRELHRMAQRQSLNRI